MFLSPVPKQFPLQQARQKARQEAAETEEEGLIPQDNSFTAIMDRYRSGQEATDALVESQPITEPGPEPLVAESEEVGLAPARSAVGTQPQSRPVTQPITPGPGLRKRHPFILSYFRSHGPLAILLLVSPWIIHLVTAWIVAGFGRGKNGDDNGILPERGHGHEGAESWVT